MLVHILVVQDRCAHAHAHRQVALWVSIMVALSVLKDLTIDSEQALMSVMSQQHVSIAIKADLYSNVPHGTQMSTLSLVLAPRVTQTTGGEFSC